MIGAPLISPLVAGTKYYVSLKVSPIISTSLAATHVISGLGAKFSTINFNSSNNDSLINNFAHVYSNQIISDSLNWTTISDSLIADSAYNYIFIGNFFDSNHFDTMQVAPTLVTTWFTAIGSFYYIDDICVSTTYGDCFISIPTSIKTEIKNLFSIVPNPISDNAIIEFNEIQKNTVVNIINTIGQIEFSTTLKNTKSASISKGNLKSGIYFVQAIDNENKVLTKKIIIE